MYLSFSNIKNIFIHFIIGLTLIFIQVYLPQIWINPNLSINFDVLLIYLTCIAFIYKPHQIVYFAFMIGLFQDLVVNIEMLGILSLLKSLSVFLIGRINNFKFLWNKKVKIIYLFVIYLFHFLVYYYVFINNDFYLIAILSFLQSLACFIIFYFIQKNFFANNFFLNDY